MTGWTLTLLLISISCIRLVFLADQMTDVIFNYFALPQYGRFLVSMFGNCLQTLLYMPALGEQIVFGDGFMVDLKSAEGTNSLYWSVVNRGCTFFPELRLMELKIEAKKSKIAQHLLYRLLSSSHFEPTLADGTPILHLLLTVGQHYIRPSDQHPVDLFELYISRHSDQVDLRCPWTGFSTLELLQKQKQEYQKSVSYQEAQIHICMAQSGGSLKSRLPPIHLAIQSPSACGDATLGKARLDEALATWRRDESKFCEELARAVVSLPCQDENVSSHGAVVDGVMAWLRLKLEGNKDARYGLEISGSVGENSKIYPLDEVDLLLQVWLDVDVEVLSLEEDAFEKIREELEKPIGKQPVQHLVKLILRKAYPFLGEIGEELTAETFGKVMHVFIADRLQNAQLPNWLRLAGGNSIVPEPVLLERTKAGLLLTLEYLDSGKWHELSIDLVPTLVLDQEQREKYLQVITIIVIKTCPAHNPINPSICQSGTKKEEIFWQLTTWCPNATVWWQREEGGGPASASARGISSA